MTDRPRSPLAMVLLALLAEEPMHAYRMQRLLKTRQKDAVVNVARSNSVYQALDRLQRDGYVAAGEKVAADSAPARVVYALTDAGREVLWRWMDEALAAPAREFPEFRAVLAVVSLHTPGLVADRLEERAARLEAILEKAAAEDELMAQMGLPRVLMLEQEHLVAVTTAELAWVRGVVDDLRSGALAWDAEQMRATSAQHEGGV